MIVMKFGGSSVADRERLQHVARVVVEHGRRLVGGISGTGGSGGDGLVGVGEVAAPLAPVPGSSGRPPLAVVVSAMGKTTDALLRAASLAEAGDGTAAGAQVGEIERLHREAAAPEEGLAATLNSLFAELRSLLDGVRLLRELTPRSRALIASLGERLSAVLLAAELRRLGWPGAAVDARRFVVTGDDFEAAAVDWPRSRAAAAAVLEPVLEAGITPVVTGFIGATAGGITTTLGRGGSDYSAALVGNLLAADEIWIWTDVAGILTADPRLVREARTLEQVSYREAAEMSYFGAKVLHPKTIGPAVAARIPIRIRNSFAPEHPGTLITETAPALPQGVKTVSSIHDLAMVTIEGRGLAGVPGMARRVFEATEAARSNVLMISQASSEQTISFVVPAADAERLVASLRQRFAFELAAGAVDAVSVDREIAVASIVGQGMAGRPGISGKLFAALGSARVNVVAIAQGASELSISVALREADAARAVRAIHSAFGLTRLVHLAVIGCGRVGRTFLCQLADTRAEMESRLGLELRLVALANSRQLLLDDAGLDPGRAARRLTTAAAGVEARPPPGELLQRLLAGRFADLVLVDLTAADTTSLQHQALAAGVHVVTANKRPLSGSLADFHRLLGAARQSGACLHYETTFGAGLPALHSLRELLDTGDRVESVRGCFSGTLGFLCTALEDGRELGDALEEARAAGLTEPDPREDLSGRDVARKALIVARTAGLDIEGEAIQLDPLLPGLERGLEAALGEHGGRLLERAQEAKQCGEVLRYVAEVSPRRVRVGPTTVPVASPIGALRGCDNILVYQTERYHALPLVIRGPGAGAEVTAAGVLGDVLKIARR